ncbi:acetylesterase [Anaerocolumna cellulosilytica]|uniref:Acetylesterase n=1 Tax=Anaerocolumna cellulosilytica TaxID=433286 RepID=A0A6S6QWG6_9FIRM|nr:alpha/beta hydrolase [Anaerocolumna cellulosilytica]MBB5197249.1 acetyl esterase/lipase [Anaerocolumna cellulosilytica]BCJ94056.1 acetylesterase [Anaerocolumna cellulosilytica]
MEIEHIIQVPGKHTEGVRLKGFVIANSPMIEAERKHPAVLICPGGGYHHLSDREAEPVAYKFTAEGVHAFILYYTIAPQGEYPQSLCEVLAALAYIREHAEEYHIDVNNIAVCGFSAGGHLAGCAGAFWNSSEILSLIGKTSEEVKPNKVILSYPVISSGEKAHKDSFINLLGDHKDNQELRDRVSLEKQVTKYFPPVLIWHTQEDGAVPVENSLYLVNALIAAGVRTEFHLYPTGRHGLSLGNYLSDRDIPYGVNHPTGEWIEKAIQFMYTEL